MARTPNPARAERMAKNKEKWREEHGGVHAPEKTTPKPTDSTHEKTDPKKTEGANTAKDNKDPNKEGTKGQEPLTRWQRIKNAAHRLWYGTDKENKDKGQQEGPEQGQAPASGMVSAREHAPHAKMMVAAENASRESTPSGNLLGVAKAALDVFKNLGLKRTAKYVAAAATAWGAYKLSQDKEGIIHGLGQAADNVLAGIQGNSAVQKLSAEVSNVYTKIKENEAVQGLSEAVGDAYKWVRKKTSTFPPPDGAHAQTSDGIGPRTADHTVSP